jgi:predicted nucleic acid-binding protein
VKLERELKNYLNHCEKNIQDWFENELLVQFKERILPLDVSVILLWGELVGELEKKGRKLPPLDSLIAATTKYYNYTLVTRNEKDFDGIEIMVFNPFAET